MLPVSCTILPTVPVIGGPGWFTERVHETARLTELIGRHAREGLTPTTLPGVCLLRATATTEPLGEVAEPAVAVIAQGAKETALGGRVFPHGADRKSTRLNSSHLGISYAVFCLKKK